MYPRLGLNPQTVLTGTYSTLSTALLFPGMLPQPPPLATISSLYEKPSLTTPLFFERSLFRPWSNRFCFLHGQGIENLSEVLKPLQKTV